MPVPESRAVISIARARALLRLARQLIASSQQPDAFRTTLLDGLRELMRGEIVSLHVVDTRPECASDPEPREVGTTAWRTDAAHAEYIRSAASVSSRDPVFAAAIGSGDMIRTVTRSDVISDEIWSKHPHRLQVRARAGIDESLSSVFRLGTGESAGIISIFYAAGATIHPEDPTTLDVLHAELGHLIWDVLAHSPRSSLAPIGVVVRSLQPSSESDSPLTRLTVAQRAVLPHLLGPMSETEIGKAICRSRYTVHDHARSIYAALGVKNRLELVVRYKSLLDDPALVADSSRRFGR